VTHSNIQEKNSTVLERAYLPHLQTNNLFSFGR